MSLLVVSLLLALSAMVACFQQSEHLMWCNVELLYIPLID